MKEAWRSCNLWSCGASFCLERAFSMRLIAWWPLRKHSLLFRLWRAFMSVKSDFSFKEGLKRNFKSTRVVCKPEQNAYRSEFPFESCPVFIIFFNFKQKDDHQKTAISVQISPSITRSAIYKSSKTSTSRFLQFIRPFTFAAVSLGLSEDDIKGFFSNINVFTPCWRYLYHEWFSSFIFGQWRFICSQNILKCSHMAVWMKREER